MGKESLPRFLTYIVTFRCNARCIMCDSWKKNGKEDLSLDEIKSIFQTLPRMDMVRLSGGEPFIRDDFAEIIGLTQEILQPEVLHITSNGFLTEKIASILEKRDKSIPLYFLLSLDGLEPVHNHVRGIKTAWKMATRTLEILAPRQKELNIRLGVNQTIVDENGFEEYFRLKEFLARYEIMNHFVLAYDISATYNTESEINLAPSKLGEYSSFAEFDASRLEWFLSEIRKDMKYYSFSEKIAKKYYLKGIENRVLNKKAIPNPSCVALSSHLRILPDGKIPTCQFNTRTAGNLRESSFDDIWNSSLRKKQREWVKNCPGCWAECEALPNALYTGDILRAFF